jgi:hypothetical protein
MSAAAAPPTPIQPEPGTHNPSRFGRLLGLVRKIIDYGRDLAIALQQRGTADFAGTLFRFGSRDTALILARIMNGLLRAGALEARLVRLAARPDPQPKSQAARSPRASRVAAPATPGLAEADARLARLPTAAQIAIAARRRPIGVVIADICRDLGIMADHPLWRDIQHAIIRHGGSLARLLQNIWAEVRPLAAAARTAASLPTPAPIGTGPP